MGKARKPVTINGIAFDALLDEDRAYEAESPDYPVEDGFAVEDTIILKPMMLSMTLLISDTPVTWKSKGHGGRGWADGIVQRLESLYFSKALCTIVTSDKTYKNYAIQSISISKSAEVGYSRQIPITFKEIRVTSSKKTTIPDSYGKSGDTGANAGAASTSTGTTPAASQSAGGGGNSGAGSSSGSSSGSGSGTGGSNASMAYNLAKGAGLLP
jgi:hypothetical protein